MSLFLHYANVLLSIFGLGTLLGLVFIHPLRTVSPLLVPLAGFIVFGGVIAPILYILGKFDLPTIIVLVSVLGVFGLARLIYSIRKIHPRISFAPTQWLGVFLLIIFTILLLALSQKNSVPGGIDPAIHSIIVNNINNTKTFSNSYPQGLHILILSLEEFFNFSQPQVFISLNNFFYLNFLILVYVAIKLVSKSSLFALIGVFTGLLDVSFFNNMLNGTTSHLIAVNLIGFSFIVIPLLSKLKRPWDYVFLIIFYTAVLYYHFVTLYFFLPFLWFWRALSREKARPIFLLSFIASLIISIPLQFRLIVDPGYLEPAITAVILTLVVELALLRWQARIGEFLANRWLLYLAVPIGTVLLLVSMKVFDIQPQWYGWPIMILSFLGLAIIAAKNLRDWIPYVYYFTAMALLNTLFFWPFIDKHASLMKELLFYYGLTSVLVILASAATYFLLVLLKQSKLKLVATTMMLVVLFLIVFSRTIDAVLIDDQYLISRYNSSRGFGIFYTRNDVLLAEWVKNNVRDDSMIINPGGLYNVWASMTMHPISYFAYGMVSRGEESHEKIVDLLFNRDPNKPTYLLDRKIRYVLVPEGFLITLYHPYLQLRKQIGGAKFYSLTDQPIRSTNLAELSLTSLTDDPVFDVSGEYKLHCLYCENRLYYQFRELAQSLIIAPGKSIKLTIKKTSLQRPVNLIINTSGTELRGAVVKKGAPQKIFLPAEYALQGYLIPANEDLVVKLENTTNRVAEIRNVVLEML